MVYNAKKCVIAGTCAFTGYLIQRVNGFFSILTLLYPKTFNLKSRQRLADNIREHCD